MNEFQTGAVRDTGGKGRMDLLPWSALIRISKHMENSILPDPETGVPHYPERNWEKGIPMHSMIDSAFRHLAKYMDGWTDEDHLCAAATNLLMAMWTEEKKPEMQDIPSRTKEKVFPSASDDVSGTAVPPTKEVQENARENTEDNISQKLCECYRDMGGSPRCAGTRELESCYCDGDKNKCTFYTFKQHEEHRQTP
jgi:hypothetical protein